MAYLLSIGRAVPITALPSLSLVIHGPCRFSLTFLTICPITALLWCMKTFRQNVFLGIQEDI